MNYGAGILAASQAPVRALLANYNQNFGARINDYVCKITFAYFELKSRSCIQFHIFPHHEFLCWYAENFCSLCRLYFLITNKKKKHLDWAIHVE